MKLSKILRIAGETAIGYPAGHGYDYASAGRRWISFTDDLSEFDAGELTFT